MAESTLDKYILDHSDPEGDYLYRLYRATNIYMLHGRMASGYSAICMAEGLGDGGKVYTFEINDEQEDFTRKWIEQSPVASKIEFIIGDAITEAPRLGISFDMAFIDGDKRTYCETYEMALKVIRQGGFILADNTLWDGHVIDHAYDKDPQTKGIERFNDLVAADTRVEKVILPLRDGLTLIRKL